MSSTGERYNLYSQGSSGWSTLRYEEFQEEDIWGVLRESKEFNSSSSSDIFNQSSTNIITSRRLSTASRMIQNSKNSSSIIEPPKIIQHSAPVNIPDWSKIYGIKKSSNNNTSWVDHDNHDDGDGGDYHGHDGMMMNGNWDSEVDDDEEENDDDDDDGNMIPPHEWIARKLERSQISSFSVCEGVGRTLKGRDLSNVRNDILTKTGFLE